MNPRRRCLCSARAADEPAGRGGISDVDSADLGRAGRTWRRRRRSRRLLRAVLQRLAPAPERTRHNFAARQLVPSGRPDAWHRLPRSRVGEVVGARRKRQHSDYSSAHARLRLVASHDDLWPDLDALFINLLIISFQTTYSTTMFHLSSSSSSSSFSFIANNSHWSAMQSAVH